MKPNDNGPRPIKSDITVTHFCL